MRVHCMYGQFDVQDDDAVTGRLDTIVQHELLLRASAGYRFCTQLQPGLYDRSCIE